MLVSVEGCCVRVEQSGYFRDRFIGRLTDDRWDDGMRKTLEKRVDGCGHDGDGVARLRPLGHLWSRVPS